MRVQKAARVNRHSAELCLHLIGVVFNDVYAASKFAMEGFCESLAVQLLKFNVT